MSGRMEGKVAFVTGAARGQGRSHAVRLAEEGADIIAVDICRQIESNPYPLSTPEDLAETVQLVEKLDRRILSFQADVRERDELRGAVEAGVAELGRLDTVVGNAGNWSLGSALWRGTPDVARPPCCELPERRERSSNNRPRPCLR